MFNRIARMFLLLAIASGLAAPALAERRAPVVLAAASLQDALTEAAERWAGRSRPKPVLSFAGSSALARQVMAGAPADLFISADEAWMDAVEEKGLLVPGTRADFLGNRLVLIAPAGSDLGITAISRRTPIRRWIGNGRIALADPRSVPAGRYAQAALTHFGLWSDVSSRMVALDNVRAVLVMVERGEVPLGVVYATDALASRQVKVIGRFAPGSHAPIRYPVARLKAGDRPEAESFRRFLLSPAGQKIFRRHGFSRP